MSEIRATTISDETGNGPIALTEQSAARMFANITTSSNSNLIKSSLNVSSMTDTATGKAELNFTNSFATAGEYCLTCGGAASFMVGTDLGNGSAVADQYPVASVGISNVNDGGGLEDTNAFSAAAHGDLA